MFCSMQRNWSKNKMTLRTRNCWESLSNIVGLYRYSRASLFLSTNVCFLHFWLDSKNVLFVFTLLPRLPVPRSRAKETFHSVGDIWLYGLIGHFNLSVSMGLHNHNCRHFAKHIWPNGPLRLSLLSPSRLLTWQKLVCVALCFTSKDMFYNSKVWLYMSSIW